MNERLILASTLFGIGALAAWIWTAMSLAYNDHERIAMVVFFTPIFGGAFYFWMTS